MSLGTRHVRSRASLNKFPLSLILPQRSNTAIYSYWFMSISTANIHTTPLDFFHFPSHPHRDAGYINSSWADKFRALLEEKWWNIRKREAFLVLLFFFFFFCCRKWRDSSPDSRDDRSWSGCFLWDRKPCWPSYGALAVCRPPFSPLHFDCWSLHCDGSKDMLQPARQPAVGETGQTAQPLVLGATIQQQAQMGDMGYWVAEMHSWIGVGCEWWTWNSFTRKKE